ncbi:hypothetical protein [Sigmofec virus UA08Rod_3874]|uniref:Uncharacterized protein n=1 Tax=Sigmofec virus UA08Rod_3874 TaxID=2929391 RepID=A0A976R7I9_9VIRU|nr:hypothetical protein [Sigmofec virus UA08Rod_3874]
MKRSVMYSEFTSVANKTNDERSDSLTSSKSAMLMSETKRRLIMLKIVARRKATK